jgi:mRNA-degrading endonuclease RelE of RelBE toxin-antitoxin system
MVRKKNYSKNSKSDFKLVPTKFFLDQIDSLSSKGKNLLNKKLIILKSNPFRNKRVVGFKLFLFRIRLKDSKSEKRIVYLVEKNIVKILCILDRKKGYRDLEGYLKKVGY